MLMRGAQLFMSLAISERPYPKVCGGAFAFGYVPYFVDAARGKADAVIHYGFTVELSTDGQRWEQVADRRDNRDRRGFREQ